MKHSIAIDTNIAIDILNGNKKVTEKCFEYESIYLPITVCGELLYGAMNSSKHQINLKKFKEFIDICIVLNTSELIAEEYASIRKKLKDNGTPIPENDIWIAAICIVNSLPLASQDKHFTVVEDLKVVLLK